MELQDGKIEINYITGNVRSGKTEYLIQQVVSLLEKNCNPKDIGIFCSTPNSVKIFSSRLLFSLKRKATDIIISTHRDKALEILSTPQARNFVGRDPRILAGFEHDFFLEDMKTSGVKPRRLKEMLKFFYRSLTEMNNIENDWLILDEERKVFELLKNNLTFYNGMLEEEVSNLAVLFLNNLKATPQEYTFKHVFVDDYQNISKASQIFSHLLATDSLTIAGNKNECLEAFESYPYPKGILELEQNLPNSKTIHLKNNPSQAKKEKNTEGSPSLSKKYSPTNNDKKSENLFKGIAKADVYPYATIPDEFEGIAHLIAHEVSTKAHTPSNISVITPNETWSNYISKYLAMNNLTSEVFPHNQRLKGDIRNLDKSALLRAYTLLHLIADPNDTVSWRCWCGYGDYLTESSSFKQIREAATIQQKNLLKTLEESYVNLAHDHQNSNAILERFSKGRELIASCKNLTGKNLLEAIALPLTNDSTLSLLEELCEPYTKQDTAALLLSKAQKKLFSPCYSQKKDTIKIGPPNSIVGFSPTLLVYTGFVNGFIPSRNYFDGTKTTLDKQQILYETNIQQLHTIVGKASEKLIISYFQKTDLESAELLKVKVDRITLEKEIRTCKISPSIFLPLIEGK